MNVRLAGSSNKADIVDQIIRMAQIGAINIQDDSLNEGTDFCGISYMTDEGVFYVDSQNFCV